MRLSTLSLIAVAATLSLACGSKAPAVENAAAPAPSAPAMASTPSSQQSATAATGPCAVADVHFAYDSADLPPAEREKIATNARCVKSLGASEVEVTGMTDPRGTEEYNLALGDRRARAVGQYMEQLGVESSIQTKSVGEEYAAGADESGWATDRRADFKVE